MILMFVSECFFNLICCIFFFFIEIEQNARNLIVLNITYKSEKRDSTKFASQILNLDDLALNFVYTFE